MAQIMAEGSSKVESQEVENAQSGLGEGRAGRVGKEGSLKHRILSRPSINLPTAVASCCPEESMHSSSNGSHSPLSSSSSSSSTPVASPASSAHCSNGASSNYAGAVEAKRPLPVEKLAACSCPQAAKSDLRLSSTSLPAFIKSTSVITAAHLPSPKASTYQPHQFTRGSLIQLANGSLKTIENMSSDDFIRSAAASPNLKVDFSEIARIEKAVKAAGRGVGSAGPTMVVYFRPRKRQGTEVAVEACEDHPFFVLGKGWSSACPAATMGRFGLHVVQLNAGDTCISLSYKEVMAPLVSAPPLHPTVLAQQQPPPSVMPPPPKPQWTSPAACKRQNTATHSPFIIPNSGREGSAVSQAKSPPATTDGRGRMVVAAAYPASAGVGGQSCAAGAASSAETQRSFIDVNAFRRWSAPEDDRFLDGFQK
ncbi:hypothetical protein RvY_18965 [Ramazzottius varieornatus]|uniref:AXH domain-containing protein n=1 Tax=Ramazzottius varieornatus TaxID=947166 RepID=A0A1D1WAB7_RAMVA|nr:hypothetical protein RvY_18965 [Ramazzottius varieornatus]